jgi:hypothetical protein
MLLVLAGCGRLEFAGITDASTLDVVTGHDEDGDGIIDTSDPCPHVAGDTTDGDGDGVGDACDPNPGTFGERFLAFSTLQFGDSAFGSLEGWDQEADAVHYADTGTTLFFAQPVTNVVIEVGFEIRALIGAGQHQVAAQIERTAQPFYFVELNENGATRDVGVISYDSTNGYLFLDTSAHNGMHTGRGLLRYGANGATHEESIVAGWTDELYTANAPTPAYTGGTTTRITFNGVDIALLYFVVIQSP